MSGPESTQGPRGGSFMEPFSYKAQTGSLELLDERTLGVGPGGIENTGVYKHVPKPEEVDKAWASLNAHSKRLKADKQATKAMRTYQALRTKTLDSFAKFAVEEDEVPASIVDALLGVMMESAENSSVIRKLASKAGMMDDMVDVETARRAFNPDLVEAASERLAVGVLAIFEALEQSSQDWKLKSVAQARFLDDTTRAYAKAIGKDVKDVNNGGGSNGSGGGNKLDESSADVAIAKIGLRFRTLTELMSPTTPTMWQPAFLGPKVGR